LSRGEEEESFNSCNTEAVQVHQKSQSPRERKQEGKIKSRQAAESDVAEGLSESATGGGFGVGKEPAGPFFAAQMRERWALRVLPGPGRGGGTGLRIST
jgi:hypothetical protein